MYISHAATLGGAEQSLIDIVKYIKEKIHPIVIIPKCGAMEDVLNNLGVTYYIFDFPQTKNSVGKSDHIKNAKDYCDSFEAAQKLTELIEIEKIDFKPLEDEELEAHYRKMCNSKKIMEVMRCTVFSVYGYWVTTKFH